MRYIVVLAAACSLASAEEKAPVADFYVAPSGSDEQPGTLEKPFATLTQAKDAVRRRIAAGPQADLTVLIRQGTYELAEPLVFTSEDSGTGEHAITYAAYPGENVVVSGGRRITAWKRGPGRSEAGRQGNHRQSGAEIVVVRSANKR